MAFVVFLAREPVEPGKAEAEEVEEGGREPVAERVQIGPSAQRPRLPASICRGGSSKNS